MTIYEPIDSWDVIFHKVGFAARQFLGKLKFDILAKTTYNYFRKNKEVLV